MSESLEVQDVKPAVGHIPPDIPLQQPSFGKNHFQVEMLVGNCEVQSQQRLLPFHQYDHDT